MNKVIDVKRQEEAFEKLTNYTINDKLGNNIEIIDGLTYSPKDVVNNSTGLGVLRSSNIKNNSLNLDDLVRVNIKELKKESYSKENDILLCVRNGSKNLIGKNTLINKKLYNFTHGAFMTVIRSDEYKYIYSLLNSSVIKKEIDKDLGATINQITKNNLKNFNYNRHINKIHRTKIANFLTSLDELIQKQEEYIEELKVQKKGYSHKVLDFKLRFNKYNVKLQNTRIKDIAQYGNGDTLEKKVVNYCTDKNMISLNSISILGKLKNNLKQLVDVTNPLIKGDLVMVLSDVATGDFLGKTAIIDKDNKYYLNQRIARLRVNENIVPEYVRYQLNNNQGYFKLRGQGSNQKNLSKADVENFIFKLPKYEEQQKIGNFLSTLDDKIELQEQKLEQLKQKKKYYLNKIFQ